MRSACRRIVLTMALAGVSAVLAPVARADEKPATDRAVQVKPWAFQTPIRSPIPAESRDPWVRNPVDAFLLQKLRASGLRPAAEADRATLIRRLSFDLHGLPPTPEDVKAFEMDSAANAYERLVDKLLASPRYGERWALHWLDLVRYAESDGFKADDKRPYAWRYRDYTIKAFNEDKPYDRFVREQIAGDELYPADPQARVATGFYRHVSYEFNAVNLEQRRQETLNDMTDTTAFVFLGLTVGCARCHDHKYDPISQEDYYRLQAFLSGYRAADVPVDRPEEMEKHRKELSEWEARTADVRSKLQRLEEPERQKFIAKRKGRFPKEYQDFYDMPPEKRTPLQQQIAELVSLQLEPTSAEIGKAMKGEAQQRWQDLNKEMTRFNREKPPSPPSAMVLSEVGRTAPPTRLLKRGDWKQPEKEIRPGFLSAIQDELANVPSPSPQAKTTGRRSVLASWLTARNNPLTARVVVNRLWQQHFGRGIVGTPSDFGAQGEAPTHPELLDWLAAEFMDTGWSIKSMHRLMVNSAAYRQSSAPSLAGLKEDPDNTLLWRMNRRRLEGETLRDAMLAVSGRLNLKEGGPSVHPELPSELNVGKAGWPVSEGAEADRRSVYVFVKRNLRYPLFCTFDAPDSNESCARRHATITAPQALMLLNGQFAHDIARAFAERVREAAGKNRAADVLAETAFQLAVGRPPAAEEKSLLVRFLEREPAQGAPPARSTTALPDLCHALLNLNEFIYVD